MKYIEFKNKLAEHQIIDIRNVITLFGKIDQRRLYEWQKQNYIKRLSNNYYMFTDVTMDDSLLKHTANKIYPPSYIALESALSYYNLIPEAVFQVKSVTTRKTKQIQNDVGFFSYHSINNSLFFGYSLKGDGKNLFYISDPEKTILDYLYFSPHLTTETDFESLRLNRDIFKEIISIQKLHNYLDIFKHRRLAKSLTALLGGFDAEF
jgi:predicted transcriptional regulator of viral defense system